MSENTNGHLISQEITVDFGATPLSLGTGKVAKQANGSVVAQVGETVVLAAVVMAPPRPEPLDFFPLTVEYREKMYANGKVPGGFFKRENRPSQQEILTSRLIDRPLRPMFPDGFTQEVQVFCTVLSYDGVNNPDLVAMIAASSALIISNIPFEKPIAGVRVGFDGTNYILNPTLDKQDELLLDLVVAGTKNAVVMVESGAKMLTEEQMLGALRFGHEAIKKICEAQEKFREMVGKPESEYVKNIPDTTLQEKIARLSLPKFAKISEIYEKVARGEALDDARESIIDELADEYPEGRELISSIFEDAYAKSMRRKVLDEGIRPDGRKLDEIRPITTDVSVLPRTHGSSLFTRGQTQSLGVLTLGTGEDTQEIDTLQEKGEHTYYMHYNFPSYSVGEVRPIRAPGRREIGHGALAERSLKPIIPNHDDFPYTIRLVSEILESNGSSSMASVCSGCLALMDGGVPIKAPVAGIAMGLIKEEDGYAVLSDIQGLEDHLGDMDFKVAGTQDGITALQMDIKIEGITFEIMEKALAQAKLGRKHILGKMAESITQPREDLSKYAPRIDTIWINPEKIRDVIGTGGKVIREIVAQTGCKIDITDDGKVLIASADLQAKQAATDWIKRITAEPEVGQIYTGKVVRIEDFGAFVELMPGKDGMVHVSELEPHRVNKVTDVCQMGDELTVKVIGIDEKGRVRLSRKQAIYTPEQLAEMEAANPKPEGGERRERGNRDRDRGDRGRGRDRGNRRDHGNRGRSENNTAADNGTPSEPRADKPETMPVLNISPDQLDDDLFEKL